MPYREVIRAGKLGGRLAGHSRSNARRVAASATEPFRDRLAPGQEFLDLYQYQEGLSDELDRQDAELIAIDDRHARQQEIDRQLREQRDDWTKQLRDALIKLKSSFEGNYGPGASRKFFHELSLELPDDPKALHQLGWRVYDTLVDPLFQLEPTLDGVAVNPKTLARGFKGPLDGLGTAIQRLHHSEGETRHTQAVKDVKLAESQDFNGKVARFLEAFSDVAGHPGLAARVRRSSHARRPAVEPGSGPAPDSGPEPAAAPAVPAGDGVSTAASSGEASPENSA